MAHSARLLSYYRSFAIRGKEFVRDATREIS